MNVYPDENTVPISQQEWQQFWNMLSEFQSRSSNPQHTYMLEINCSDGTTETLEVCVDFLAIQVVVGKLKSFGFTVELKQGKGEISI